MSEQNNTWNVRIQHKKDSAENWQFKNPVLLLNELIIVEMESGDCRFKIGDGIHAYSDLPFADQLLRDAVESKVSKEEGKALSSNDFTDDLKNKLDGISIMKGATADADGTSGLVPPPAQGADSKFLRGDGAWAALSPSDIGAAPTEHKHSASDITDGVLPIKRGGTASNSILGARAKLEVPIGIDVSDTSNGFPFTWGSVVARGNLGDTIGHFVSDNYYWGVDSDAILWGGSQINGATEVNWKPAMMMNSDEQRFHALFSGTLNAGQSMTLSNGNKYAALIIAITPNSLISTSNMVTVPTGDVGVYVLSRNQDNIIEQVFVKVAYLNSNDLTIYVENGLIRYIWGILKYRK